MVPPRSWDTAPSSPFGHPLDRVAEKARRARRWALRLWAVLGVACLAAGSAYAAGLPSVGGETDLTGSVDASAARLVDTSPGGGGGGLYDDAMVSQGDITYTWGGRHASIGDEPMFLVDLTGHTGTFAAEVVLSNGAAMTGWWRYQLKVAAVPVADAGTCAGYDFSGAEAGSQLLTADTVDAWVQFSGLAGGSMYCIGAADGDGKDSAGTYLRRASTTTVPTYPTFVGSVAKTAA